MIFGCFPLDEDLPFKLRFLNKIFLCTKFHVLDQWVVWNKKSKKNQKCEKKYMINFNL